MVAWDATRCIRRYHDDFSFIRCKTVGEIILTFFFKFLFTLRISLHIHDYRSMQITNRGCHCTQSVDDFINVNYTITLICYARHVLCKFINFWILLEKMRNCFTKQTTNLNKYYPFLCTRCSMNISGCIRGEINKSIPF